MKKVVIILTVALSCIGLCVGAFFAFNSNEPEHVHVYGEWEVLREASCLNSGEQRRVCECGAEESEVLESFNHEGNIYTVDATCTTDGYVKYECDTCGNEYVSDYIYAKSHTYGEWIASSEPSCSSNGEQVRACLNCGETEIRSVAALGHHYELSDTYTLDNTEHSIYSCSRCEDSYDEIGKSLSSDDVNIHNISLRNTELEMFNIPRNFAFNIISDGDEAYIKQNLKIYDAYFEDSEYLDIEDIYVDFSVVSLGDGVWQITNSEGYSYACTYAAVISGDLAFEEYECAKLNFTVETDENHEDVIDYNDDIVFLKKLEAESPGYYPYSVQDIADCDYLYLTVSKVGALEVGQILCVGDISSFDEMSSIVDTECYIGKIGEINKIDSKTYIVRLDAPAMEEVFDNFDISFVDDINFEENAELVENLEEEIIAALYENEEYLAFLNSVYLAANSYISREVPNAIPLSTESFLDNIKITPSVHFDGTKLIMNIYGEIDIPIHLTAGDEFGNITISFLLEATSSIKMNLSYSLKYWWFIPTGIRSFDLRFEQNNNFKFNFDVDIKLEYTLTEEEFEEEKEDEPEKSDDDEEEDDDEFLAYNKKTHVLHRAECLYVSRIVDKSKIQYVSDAKANKILETEKDSKTCEKCKPLEDLIRSTFVINKSEKTIHAYNCYHCSSIAEKNKLISRLPFEYWAAQGYNACDWCHPEKRELDEFKEEMQKSLEYADWDESLGKIKEASQASNVSSGSKRGVTVANVSFPVGAALTAKLQVSIVFDFKLEASLSYKYEYTQNNVFGIRLQSNRIKPYSSQIQNVPVNSLEIVGKAELRAGVELDANIAINGIGKWANAGLRAELGGYTEVSGVYVDSNVAESGVDYAAAYLEVGVYADVDAYYNLLAFKGEIGVLERQIPLLSLGYDSAYYAYTQYYDTLEIKDSYDIDKNDLLTVNYFDLKTMTQQTTELSLDEKDKYRVTLSLADGTHCEIIDGVIVAKDGAPCSFTDQLIISVSGTQSGWGKYKKGNSIFYLDTYVIELIFTTKNAHSYVLSETKAPGCTKAGVSLYVCSHCKAQKEEPFGSPAHSLGEWQTKLEPDCTTGGEEIRKCLNCTYEETRPVSSLGHNFSEWETRVEATDTSDGEEYRYCYKCAKEEMRAIAAKNHSFGKWVEAIPATCQKEGTLGHYLCSDCKKYFDADKKSLSSIVEEKKSHYMGEWQLQGSAGCTGAGQETRQCKNCTYTETREAQITHNYSLWISAVPATCEAEGTLGHYMCIDCNKYFDAEKNELSSISEGKLEHTFDAWKPAIDATCERDGTLGHYLCAGCKKYFDEEKNELLSIVDEKKEHNFVDGICSGCGLTNKYSEGLEFTDMGDYYVVSGIGTCTDTEIIIPATYNGKIVKRIGDHAFASIYNIKSVEIPDSVTMIDDRAFDNCRSMLQITIPGSVESIGDFAFCSCVSLNRADLVEGLKSIGNGAFYGCYNLSMVTLPEGLTTIGEDGFYNCPNIESVIIPGSLTNMGTGIFRSCKGLETVVILEGVERIENSAFSHCFNLVNIILPNSLTSIGDYSFWLCESLASITMPDGVISIGDSAFRECRRLNSITIPGSVVEIYPFAFLGCGKLTSVMFANPSGWKAGETSISESELQNPATAAEYLAKYKYYASYWSRN